MNSTAYYRNFKVFTNAELRKTSMDQKRGHVEMLEKENKKNAGRACQVIYAIREACFLTFYFNRQVSFVTDLSLTSNSTVYKDTVCFFELEWYEDFDTLKELEDLFSKALKSLVPNKSGKFDFKDFNHAEEKLGWYRYCVWRLQTDLGDKGVFCVLCNKECINSRAFNWCTGKCDQNCAFAYRCANGCDQRELPKIEEKFVWESPE